VVVRISDFVAKLVLPFVIYAQFLIFTSVRVPVFRDVVVRSRVVVAEELREVGEAGVVVCVVCLEVEASAVVGWGFAVAADDAEGVACDAVFGFLGVLGFGGSGFGAGA